jgi:uncharacterized protein YkwD
MRKNFIHIASLILFLLLFIGFLGEARANQSPDPIEVKLLALINEARRDPLAMAGSFGLDPNQVLSDLPELSEILTHGLPALVLNQQLYDAALAHTRDMMDNNYYGNISPDGRSFYDRTVEAGYGPVVTGESLGIMAFYNFIGPDTAVQILFKNMFLDELDSERTEPRNILNPYMQDAGIGIDAGVMNLDSGHYNVYLATCDFGAGKAEEYIIREMELHILQLINQARVKPFEVADTLGIDVNEFSDLLPDLYNAMAEGLPPLASDQRLFRAAQDHSAAMAQGDFYGHESEDGRYYEERMSDAGYDATLSGEVLSRVRISDYPDPQAAAQALFDEIFKKELDPSYQGDRVILNPDMEDAGVGVALGQITSPGSQDLYYLLTGDFAAGGGSGSPRLVGVVFEDKDSDGLYTPGEGVEDEPVIVYGAGLHLRTDKQGGVQSEVDSGGYWVILFSQTEPLKFIEVTVGDRNTWFEFIVDE